MASSVISACCVSKKLRGGLASAPGPDLGADLIPSPDSVGKLFPGAEVTRRYSVLGLSGRGTSWAVWKLQHKTTKELASCRVMEPRSRSDVEMGLNEVQVLKKLSGRHPGTFTLKEVLHAPGGRAEVVTDSCTGLGLRGLLQRRGAPPEPAARVLFTQLAQTLAFCHSQGIVHRSVKPSNILVTSSADVTQRQGKWHARLADFSLATVLPHGCSTVSGAVCDELWSAPEMLKGDQYSFNSDVWSLGLVLYCLLTGSVPAPADPFALMEPSLGRVLKGPVLLSQKHLHGVSLLAQDLLTRMLEVDPMRRISCDEVLQHPWLSTRLA